MSTSAKIYIKWQLSLHSKEISWLYCTIKVTNHGHIWSSGANYQTSPDIFTLAQSGPVLNQYGCMVITPPNVTLPLLHTDRGLAGPKFQ